MGRADGHREGIDTGPVHELHGLLRRGEPASLLLAQLGHIPEFRLDIGAIGLRHLHGFCRCLHILLERLLGRVDHHGVKALVQAPLHQLQARAVIQVDIPLQPVIGHHLTAHLVRRMEAHIVDGRARKLQHHRRFHRLRSLRHAHQRLIVIEIRRQHRRLPGLALIKHFPDRFHNLMFISNLKVIHFPRKWQYPFIGTHISNDGDRLSE